MSVRATFLKQYQTIIDDAANAPASRLAVPREGWIATMRKALSMSGADLARRMGLKRGRISQAEKAEIAGGVTLKTMAAAAEAMGGRFVYAIVPNESSVLDLIARQARKKARALVEKTSVHMALENQSLSPERNADEIDRIALELARVIPGDLWTDE